MARLEFSAVMRFVLSVMGAAAISAGGVALTILTGSFALGWMLVPGGMLALENIGRHPRLWTYGGILLNVSLWTLVIYIVTDFVRGRRRRAAA